MTLSQLALEDVEALCSETSFLMADPMGPLLDEDAALFPLKEEGPQSPALLSHSSQPLSPHELLFSTPPSSASPASSRLGHSVSLTEKSPTESLFMPWLSAGSLLDAKVGADDCKDDAFVGMEWMAEKVDLSELDLDSLIGSCSSDVSSSSPEVLLPALDAPMALDLDPFPPTTPSLTLSIPLELPIAPVEEDVVTVNKSEPLYLSLCPSPAPAESSGPSEGDLLDEEQTTPVAVSLPSAGSILVVLADDLQPPGASLLDSTLQVSPSLSEWDSDSGIESLGSSPTRVPSLAADPAPTDGSSRTKPYAKSPSAVGVLKRAAPAPPKLVERKMKKMEQNKTAATRYRHKKRIEQELLNSELEELEKKNGELTEKAESISREIKYLKDLMEEVRKRHRGRTSSIAS